MIQSGFKRQIAEWRARTLKGDRSAAVELRSAYGRSIERIVERVACRDRASSPFERQILNELRRTRQTAAAGADFDALVRTVSGRLMHGLLTSPPPAPAARPGSTLRRPPGTVRAF